MATKKCPHCGKKIAVQAQYCLYCTKKFDEVPIETGVSKASAVKHNEKKKRKGALPVVIIAVVILLIGCVLGIAFAFGWVSDWLALLIKGNSNQHNSATQPTTGTTVSLNDPDNEAFLQTHIGYWVDTNSMGKGDIVKQGGMELQIHSVSVECVEFDIVSYSESDTTVKKAFLNDVTASVDVYNTLHFTFEDDGNGHAGEGHLRFRGDEIDLEILIDNADEAHSLAMNTVFKRQSLPNAEGLDILSFGTLEDILTAIGDPIQEPVTDEESKKTTYEFESLQVVVDEQGAVEEVTARFEQGVTPSVVYRYDRVDGTMPYEVIKRYFGEAEHDYTEQPTNIRVLHYDRLGRTAETTFVFSADNDLLITIRYSL